MSGPLAGVLSDRRIVELLVLGVMAVWATNFIVVKDVLAVMPPVGFTFLRYFVSSLGLVWLLWWSERHVAIPRPEAIRIMALGGIGFGLYQILWTVGLVEIPAGDSALIIASTPVFTALIAVAARTDTLTPLKGLGVLATFIGVVLVIAAGVGIELTGSVVGFALTLGATLCWATYTALGARVMRRVTPLELTTWATIGGTIVLAPLGLAQLVAPGTVHVPDGGTLLAVVGAVLFSGLLAAGLSNVVVFAGVRLLGPTRISAIQALVPALAVVLAFLVLGEPIRPVQILGGAIIILGVAMTRSAYRRRRA